MSTTIGSDIEHNNCCGQTSTFVKVMSIKDVDLLSQFDNINENDNPFLSRITDLPPQIRSTPYQKMLIDNHVDAKKGEIKGYLYVEDVFGFCKSLNKVTKILGFHLMIKTMAEDDLWPMI